MLAPQTTLHCDTFGYIDGNNDGTLLWMTSYLFRAKMVVKVNQHTNEHFRVLVFSVPPIKH